MQIVETPISDIKVRFRLRTPSEEKVQEIADSISQVGLINAVTLDSDLNLIAGWHRLTAFKLLGKQTIPSIIKDSSAEFAELMEVDENLKRNELNHIEVAEHIVRREELMDSLGLTYQQGDNAHTRSDEKLTVQDLADGIGLSKWSYQQRKQLCRINEEVRSMLTETPYAENLVDLIKLSSLSDEMQLDVCNLLITGECRSWASAFYKAQYKNFKLSTKPRLDFNFKERWGYPQSIMKFNRVHDDLRNTCNLVNNDDELRVQKSSVNFGRTKIKLHQMNPEQALFALDYYTREGDLVADMFNGRGTTAITALHLQRRFVGFEINPTAHKKTIEVLSNNVDADQDQWHLYQGCGCEMKELESESEILDAVFSSPPYLNNAEKYNSDPNDLCNMNQDQYEDKIDVLFKNISRLIKRSSYENRTFKPIIFTLGTTRDGQNGILDLELVFKLAARKHNLTYWDTMFVELNNPYLAPSLQRNYELGFVQKNYESQLVWVKF